MKRYSVYLGSLEEIGQRLWFTRVAPRTCCKRGGWVSACQHTRGFSGENLNQWHGPFRCVGSGVMHDIVRVYKVALAQQASYYARYRGQPMLLFACLLWVFYFYYVFLSLFGICGLSEKVTASKHATAYPSKGCQQKQFMLEIWSCLTEFYAALQDGDNWFALHKNLK